MKKITKNALKIIALTAATFFLLSCNPVENDSQSNSQLIVLKITGKDFQGNSADYLQSDVVKVDEVTGAQTIFADPAIASLTAKLINPDPMGSLSQGTTQYNDIMVKRYVVTYLLPDGTEGTPGVNVPYPHEGSLSVLVEIGSSTSISFILVREVAKAEPPLLSLYYGGGEGVLQLKARVDFYGHDLAENWVQATGYITIFFANYVD